MATILGATPVNQLNALPLITATAAAADGDINIVGGAITRYWSAAITGVNGATPSIDANGFRVLPTNFLNVTGCARFACIVQRFSGIDQAAALASMGLQLQYRFNKVTTPPTSNTVDPRAVIAMFPILTTRIIFPSILAGAFQTSISCWSIDSSVGSGGTIVPGMIGSDVRLVAEWSTNPVAANNLFEITLWGNS
jgi:hypothetical protein